MIALIKNSLANLKGHKLRLAISFVWIIIGITSVVFVSAVGNGVTTRFKSTFQTLAPRTSIFYFEPEDSNMGKHQQVLLDPFNRSDAQEISVIDGVKKVDPSKKFAETMPGISQNMFSSNITFFNKETSSNIVKSEGEHYKIIKGRALNEGDIGYRNIVITNEVAKELFGEDQDPIGKGVTIANLTFEVVGISDADRVYDPVDKEFKKRGPFDATAPACIIPVEAYNFLTGGNVKTGTINSIVVTIKDGYDIKKVNDEILDTLAAIHPDINGSYKVQDQTSIQKSTEEFTKGIDKFVRIITVVAMIVGGVGIMNIMYVSVMERNKEIGIRRALGAKPKTILAQFLFESVFITSIGGVFGVIIGYAVTIYSQSIMPFKPIPSFNSFFYAVLSIVLTGIIFGLVPAYKASKVDPIKIIYK